MEQLIMQTNIIREGEIVARQGEDISGRLAELAASGYGKDAIAHYESVGVIKRVRKEPEEN